MRLWFHLVSYNFLHEFIIGKVQDVLKVRYRYTAFKITMHTLHDFEYMNQYTGLNKLVTRTWHWKKQALCQKVVQM